MVPAKQRQSVQVLEDAEFLDETDDGGMHWTEADFKCPARAWENNAHKIYQDLNDGNDFKHRETYKILGREPRWVNLRDDGLNHAGNIPRNVAMRTSNNSSPENSVEPNNLSEDPDGLPTPQSTGPNSYLDGSLYEGRSRPIGQKLYKKNLVAQKAMDGVATSGSSILTMLDELRQAEVMERLAKRGEPAWYRTQIAAAQSKIRSSDEDEDDKPGGSGMDESDDEEDI
ncbi:hypothetical protein GIB67_004467 [Kingdonia uniflora]|uniref:No apical meristem-associated C-terminal domain-containing protein n=1 Tax=Kingdonia uniflora TaxID=39325 RepID=A0A7J7MRG7_9MAGN|nr:hypothetical protein GIB67_004467 [Kingdonia uniflora]